MTTKDIIIKNQLAVYEGFFTVKRYTLQQRRFDGSWTDPYLREFIAKPQAIGALPYDPQRDQIILIEQFRIGALEQTVTPWLIEIVAGVMDHDQEESDEELLRREMREETSLEVEDFIVIHEYFTSPGYSTEKLKLYCVKVDAAKAPPFCGLPSEQEDIKIHVVSSQDAFAAVRSGHINNSFTIIALQWLELNLARVKKLWSS